MVKKGPLPEDLDVGYLVSCELERLRRLAWKTEVEERAALRRCGVSVRCFQILGAADAEPSRTTGRN
jgi:hypothetical protein